MYYNKISKINEPSLFSLVFFTFISALLCTLFGYICIPFAAGFYAVLVLAESKGRFLFSFLIPSITFALNVFLNGFYSLEGIAYVAVGLVLYFCYRKNKTKNETAFWVTSLIILLFLFSAALVAFEEMGNVRLSAVSDFYGEIYNVQRTNVMSVLTMLATKNELGVTTYLYNTSVAEEMFIGMVKLLIPLIILSAFLLCGLSVKIFTGKASKYNDETVKVFDWKFCPPSIVSYFFLIVSIMTIFVTDGIFAESVYYLDFIFSFVFAYMGFKFLRMLSKDIRGGSFVTVIFVLLLFLSASFAFSLLTYFGAFYTISTNKKLNVENKP